VTTEGCVDNERRSKALDVVFESVGPAIQSYRGLRFLLGTPFANITQLVSRPPRLNSSLIFSSTILQPSLLSNTYHHKTRKQKYSCEHKCTSMFGASAKTSCRFLYFCIFSFQLIGLIIRDSSETNEDRLEYEIGRLEVELLWVSKKVG